jgi:hypothetical protein
VKDENDLIRVMTRTRDEPVPCPVVVSLQVRRLLCPAWGCEPRPASAVWLLMKGLSVPFQSVCLIRAIVSPSRRSALWWPVGVCDPFRRKGETEVWTGFHWIDRPFPQVADGGLIGSVHGGLIDQFRPHC